MKQPAASSRVKTDKATKLVSVLGSTGSVGCNTLDLMARHPDKFKAVAISGNRNVELLAEQARKFNPALAVVAEEDHYKELKQALSGTGVEAAAGRDSLVYAAELEADLILAGIVGIAGLESTLAAAKTGAIVALANKECLVCAGDLLLRELEKSGGTLLPVDSEHNAIFQVFDFDQVDSVRKLILTASGGPFLNTPIDKMASVTPKEAVAHPNWDMGAKISVDSATMMNKGLELIEAYHLFPVTSEQIDILIHPQSVIHSMVEYVDGSVLAQLGTPDMRTPIAYALAWPDRVATPAPSLDLAQIAALTFEAPDVKQFPSIRLASEALKSGDAAPIVLNAANEIAVHQFLNYNVPFLAISEVVEETLNLQTFKDPKSIYDVTVIDFETRKITEDLVRSIRSAN
ncbi:MAG: 1-deoxy-D-xylulose-5-phosphate reductoisomerase [Rhodospirillaceae bacterium]|nr:1-deoxy-D-xylulose-5-phosphate reductoisomerase [Rhodospirillaceae bacterium]